MHYDVVTDACVTKHLYLQNITPSDVGCQTDIKSRNSVMLLFEFKNESI